jgi:hypothetical protein
LKPLISFFTFGGFQIKTPSIYGMTFRTYGLLNDPESVQLRRNIKPSGRIFKLTNHQNIPRGGRYTMGALLAIRRSQNAAGGFLPAGSMVIETKRDQRRERVRHEAED